MPSERRMILQYADQAGYTPDLECYLRHGGYQTLQKALALTPKTLPDGRYTVEFVECLASCGTAPVLMLNDQFHETVTPAKADQILGQCK